MYLEDVQMFSFLQKYLIRASWFESFQPEFFWNWKRTLKLMHIYFEIHLLILTYKFIISHSQVCQLLWKWSCLDKTSCSILCKERIWWPSWVESSRQMFCLTHLIKVAQMYHNHMPLLYTSNIHPNGTLVRISLKLSNIQYVSTINMQS